MRVHLFPSSGPISSSHFLKTIVNYEENCKTDTLLNFINDSSIKNSLRNESYPCWGVTNGDKDRNKKLWMKMEKNDIGLFYKNKRFIEINAFLIVSKLLTDKCYQFKRSH